MGKEDGALVAVHLIVPTDFTREVIEHTFVVIVTHDGQPMP